MATPSRVPSSTISLGFAATHSQNNAGRWSSMSGGLGPSWKNKRFVNWHHITFRTCFHLGGNFMSYGELGMARESIPLISRESKAFMENRAVDSAGWRPRGQAGRGWALITPRPNVTRLVAVDSVRKALMLSEFQEIAAGKWLTANIASLYCLRAHKNEARRVPAFRPSPPSTLILTRLQRNEGAS